MREFRTMNIGAAVALMSLSTPVAMPASPPLPGQGRRRAPNRPYERKVPVSSYDFARLEAAERKRARKAAKISALSKQEA